MARALARLREQHLDGHRSSFIRALVHFSIASTTDQVFDKHVVARDAGRQNGVVLAHAVGRDRAAQSLCVHWWSFVSPVAPNRVTRGAVATQLHAAHPIAAYGVTRHAVAALSVATDTARFIPARSISPLSLLTQTLVLQSIAAHRVAVNRVVAQILAVQLIASHWSRAQLVRVESTAPPDGVTAGSLSLLNLPPVRSSSLRGFLLRLSCLSLLNGTLRNSSLRSGSQRSSLLRRAGVDPPV